MHHQDKYGSVWNRMVTIATTVVIFASSGSMFGSAFGNIQASLLGATLGIILGVWMEFSSQKKQKDISE